MGRIGPVIRKRMQEERTPVELREQASKEQDPARLPELIAEISRCLEEKEQRLKNFARERLRALFFRAALD